MSDASMAYSFSERNYHNRAEKERKAKAENAVEIIDAEFEEVPVIKLLDKSKECE